MSRKKHPSVLSNSDSVIRQQLAKNGKKTRQGEFLKYTAQQFFKKMKLSGEQKRNVLSQRKGHGRDVAEKK